MSALTRCLQEEAGAIAAAAERLGSDQVEKALTLLELCVDVTSTSQSLEAKTYKTKPFGVKVCFAKTLVWEGNTEKGTSCPSLRPIELPFTTRTEAW